ncbi:MAG: LysM peptidoglycan-binding domain-containing protein, partial [Chloroflexi bacterium]|nr:LysM peptidoglycan-binding domain-containing protein [Chloroflexota bacterium]
MQPLPTTPHIAARGRERLTLFGLALGMLLAGLGLAAVAGLPRLPADVPRLAHVSAVLSGSTLPLEALVLVLVDATWLMWLWIIGSLALELLVVGAEAATRGAAWVGSLRRLADRMTLPLVRRAVAATFAVQVLSRGVPLAMAEPLPPPTELVLMASPSSVIGPQPASAMGETPAAATYVVRADDTLWSIADQAYGSGTMYRRLVEANLGRRMPDGRVFTAQGVIRPGWELVVPPPSALVDEVDGERWYTVEAGDTLSDIAATFLGDDSNWHALFELNRAAASPDGRHSLTDPNVIWPGLRLRLPKAATAPAEIAEPDPPPGRGMAELVAASTTLTQAPSPRPAPAEAVVPETIDQPPPLHRAVHDFEPIALEPADSAVVVPDDAAPPGGSDSTLPTSPPPA